jgi:MerR family transcriptional regulator/heat shock protein HspR
VPEDRPPMARYAISVAAEISGTAAHNIRVYERRGLLRPARTQGQTRRYSDTDIERLARITDLLEAGLNLAGIAMVMQLQDDNAALRSRIGELEHD